GKDRQPLSGIEARRTAGGPFFSGPPRGGAHRFRRDDGGEGEDERCYRNSNRPSIGLLGTRRSEARARRRNAPISLSGGADEPHAGRGWRGTSRRIPHDDWYASRVPAGPLAQHRPRAVRKSGKSARQREAGRSLWN